MAAGQDRIQDGAGRGRNRDRARHGAELSRRRGRLLRFPRLHVSRGRRHRAASGGAESVRAGTRTARNGRDAPDGQPDVQLAGHVHRAAVRVDDHRIERYLQRFADSGSLPRAGHFRYRPRRDRHAAQAAGDQGRRACGRSGRRGRQELQVERVQVSARDARRAGDLYLSGRRGGYSELLPRQIRVAGTQRDRPDVAAVALLGRAARGACLRLGHSAAPARCSRVLCCCRRSACCFRC